MTKTPERRLINAKLQEALIRLEQAHQLITPETHGESYFPVINDIEDVLEKVRNAIAA